MPEKYFDELEVGMKFKHALGDSEWANICVDQIGGCEAERRGARSRVRIGRAHARSGKKRECQRR